MKRQRLDKRLVSDELARSRSHAQRLIEDEKVWIDGFPASKASTLVEPGVHVEVRGQDVLWVGRGGRKLWPLIERGWLDPEGQICLDVGASTGGFTQALLRSDADRVYAVDVGYGQLNYQLRQSEHVVVRDRYNFRHASSEDFQPPPECFTMDVSFISTRKLLDALNEVMKPEAEGLMLVKPQFEAGPDANEEGIVRDPDVHREVLTEVIDSLLEKGWGTTDVAPAPLKGQEGNQEFFVRVVRGASARPSPERLQRVIPSPDEEPTPPR